MNRLLLSSFATLFAALALGAGGAAASAPLSLYVHDVGFGPVLSGDSLIYGTTQLDKANNADDFLHVWHAKPGSLPTELFNFDVGNYEHQLDLAASDQMFIAGEGEVEDCGDEEAPYPCLVSLRFAAGSVDQPGAALAGCMPARVTGNNDDDPFFTQPLVAADGTAVAGPVDTQSECGMTSHVEIRDLGSAGTPISVPGSAQNLVGLALAGRYLAIARADKPRLLDLTLFDRATASIVYTRSFRADADRGIGLDIQADGTSALNAEFKKRASRHKTVPLCRTPRAIVTIDATGVSTCRTFRPETAEVKLSDDTLAAYAHGRFNATLVAMNIRSGSVQTIRTTADSWAENFDFNGIRFGWMDAGCNANYLAIADFEPGLATVQTRCPLRVGTRTLVLHRFRWATVPITCVNGCYGYWSIAGPKSIAEGSPIHSGEVTFYDGDFMSYEPSPTARAHKFDFYYHVSDYLKGHRLKKIALRWRSYQSSLDGRTHERTFNFKVKYR